jgi:hypothetical protein
MMSGTCHHIPDERSFLEFTRDMAKCQEVYTQTAANQTTIAWLRALINCLKVSGYGSDAAPARNVDSKENQICQGLDLS